MRQKNKPKVRASIMLSCMIQSAMCFADVATHISDSPIIDGIADESLWQAGEWYPIDFPTIGELPSAEDFSARYTVRWKADAIYLLVKVQDDVLFDQHADPLVGYWSDDCLEIFIDEDASGGDHRNNYNAFAYHLALDNQAVDIGPDGKGGGKPLLLNNHIDSAWQRSSTPPHEIEWEVKISVYPDTFHHLKPVPPVKLTSGKKIGFMLSYCDNDGSPSRESFIGSHPIEPVNGDKNRGYIDASVFDVLILND